MRHHFKSTFAAVSFGAVLAFIGGTPAQATTLGFDDLDANPAMVPVSYAGFESWSNFYSISGELIPASGYATGTISSHNVIYNLFGDEARLKSATPFTFNSAYFTGVWRDGLAVTVTAYLLGIVQHSETFTVNTTEAQHKTFNWTNVDYLVFSAAGGTIHPGYRGFNTSFAMDDFTFNAPVSAVPVPAALPLLASGLAGLGFLSRRHKRKR